MEKVNFLLKFLNASQSNKIWAKFTIDLYKLG